MRIARKLLLNFGWRALLVLGPCAYLRYLVAFFRNFRSHLRAGNLVALDRVMSSRPIKARVNGGKFIIDCAYSDRTIDDGTFTFGIVREIYIRNCYLRYGVSRIVRQARTVVDLGANRGAFSLMMARQARFVLAVEWNPLFKDVIAHNMAANGFTNYEIETVFAGEGGMCDDGKTCRTTIPDLLQKYHLEGIDLIKIDIEGSEFALFQPPEWLECISALCMEVHPEYGDPQEITAALARYDFVFVVTDCEFRPVGDPKQAEFIYAWKPCGK